MQKISKRPRSFRQVFNKSPIETRMTKETSYTFDICRTQHFFNCINFRFINFNTPSIYLYKATMECTFCIYTRPQRVIKAKLMIFSRSSNLFNTCMHAVIMTVSYFLHSVSLHVFGVLMFTVNEKRG